MTVVITKDKLPELIAAVKHITGREVLVGIPAENIPRKPEPGESDVPNNAVIGYEMEFGVPERNIPARPFLLPGVANARERILTEMFNGGQAALSGDGSQINKTFEAIGLIAQRAVQRKIVDGPFMPLSPRTLAQRKARGRTGTRPLNDTGQLRKSVTYVVRNRDTTK